MARNDPTADWLDPNRARRAGSAWVYDRTVHDAHAGAETESRK
jgi:hypothetical protein